MHNYNKAFFILCLLSAGFWPTTTKAQIDDIGLRTGITLQKQITRQLEGTLTEELRLHNDLTTINQLLTEIGISYSVTKKFKAGFSYRFINSNQDNYYSKRHRIFVDLSYKEKIKSITLTVRERIQSQYSDYYSSENGKIPVWTLRSKITAKFDLNKKYSPYLSYELYYIIDNAKELEGVSRHRYETGINYDFNRIHSLNPFLLFQHTVSPPFDQLSYGLAYTYSF